MRTVLGLDNSAAGHHTEEVVQQPTAPNSRPWLPAWLLHEAPYIAMLVLAVIGVTFHVGPYYWLGLTPVFAAISIGAGWHHFRVSEGHFRMISTLSLQWLGLLMALLVTFSGGERAEINDNGQALNIMNLLALGTFTAGVTARVWRFCAVGALLFAAVPALAWMDQSPLFMVLGIIVVSVAGGFAWWLDRRNRTVVLVAPGSQLET